MKLNPSEVKHIAEFLDRVHTQEGDMTTRRLRILLEIYLQQPETSIPNLIKTTGIQASSMTKLLQSWAHRDRNKKKGPGYISITPDPMNLKTRIIEITGQGTRAVHNLFQAGESNEDQTTQH